MPQVTAIPTSMAGQLSFRAVIRAVSNEISFHLPHDHVVIALISSDGQIVTVRETGLHTEWGAETTATKAVDDSGGLIDRMPKHTQIALYRIVQEAVNTAFRHSGAGRIVVRIAAIGQHTTIGVPDDGKCLSSELRRHASGIDNMRTGVALIDVGLKLKSGPKGTEVRLKIDGRALAPKRESSAGLRSRSGSPLPAFLSMDRTSSTARTVPFRNAAAPR